MKQQRGMDAAGKKRETTDFQSQLLWVASQNECAPSWPKSQMLRWSVTTQLVHFQIVDGMHHTLAQHMHDMHTTKQQHQTNK